MKFSAFSTLIALSACLSAVFVNDASAVEVEEATVEEPSMQAVIDPEEDRFLRGPKEAGDSEPVMINESGNNQNERKLPGYGYGYGYGGYGGYSGGYGGYGGYSGGFTQYYQQPVVYRQPVRQFYQPVFYSGFRNCGKMGCGGKMGGYGGFFFGGERKRK